jgi:hypothetical protein
MQGYLNRSFSMEIDNERMHTADAAGAQTSKWNAMNAASLTNDEGRTMKKGLCYTPTRSLSVLHYCNQCPLHLTNANLASCPETCPSLVSAQHTAAQPRQVCKSARCIIPDRRRTSNYGILGEGSYCLNVDRDPWVVVTSPPCGTPTRLVRS